MRGLSDPFESLKSLKVYGCKSLVGFWLVEDVGLKPEDGKGIRV